MLNAGNSGSSVSCLVQSFTYEFIVLNLCGLWSPTSRMSKMRVTVLRYLIHACGSNTSEKKDYQLPRNHEVIRTHIAVVHLCNDMEGLRRWVKWKYLRQTVSLHQGSVVGQLAFLDRCFEFLTHLDRHYASVMVEKRYTPSAVNFPCIFFTISSFTSATAQLSSMFTTPDLMDTQRTQKKNLRERVGFGVEKGRFKLRLCKALSHLDP